MAALEGNLGDIPRIGLLGYDHVGSRPTTALHRTSTSDCAGTGHGFLGREFIIERIVSF